MWINKLNLLLLTVLLWSCKRINDDCNLQAYPNAPQLLWQTEVKGSKQESHGHFVLSCQDGGFLQVGETGFIPNTAKILVVKIDENGALIWKKEFGESGHNLGNAAIETEDAYWIAGALAGNSALLKLNKTDGSLILETSIDNGGYDAFESISLSSAGIIAVGYINAEDSDNTFFTQGQGYISLLDLSGNKTKGINIDQYLAHAYRIAAANNGFLISGLTQDAANYGLIKIDSQANVLWAKNYGGTEADHCFGMDIDSNGNIFLTGHTTSGTQNWDTYTIKIDADGTQIWERKVGNPRGFDPKYIHDEAWGIKCTPDGGCIIVAGTGDEYNNYARKCGSQGDDSNTWHIYLISLNKDGNINWQQTYAGPEGQDWAGEDIDLTLDGGIIVALDNGQFGFVKLNLSSVN